MFILLNQYSNLIFYAFVIRILLEIVPKTSKGIDYVYNFRKKVIKFAESIFDNTNKLDIVFFTRIIFPFVIFVLIHNFLIIFEFSSQGIYDILAIGFLLLIVANMIPGVEDIDLILATSIRSKYFFIAKLLVGWLLFVYNITIEGIQSYFVFTIIIITPFSILVD